MDPNAQPPENNQLQPKAPQPTGQPAPVQQPMQPSTPPPAPPRTPEQILPNVRHFSLHKMLLIALIILVIIFGTAYIGTFYLLNKQLDKLTHASKVQLTPTLPITRRSPTLTPNPTANWKTYTSKFNYMFRYPEDATLYEGKKKSVDGIYSDNPNVVQMSLADNTIFTIAVSDKIDDTSAFGTPNVFYPDVKKRNIQVSNYSAEELLDRTFGPYGSDQIGLKQNNLYFLFVGEPQFSDAARKIIDTFTFTSTSPSPTTPTPIQSPTTSANQVVCTQEVKLCPDGKTYVSRQGPNCEYTACP